MVLRAELEDRGAIREQMEMLVRNWAEQLEAGVAAGEVVATQTVWRELVQVVPEVTTGLAAAVVVGE